MNKPKLKTVLITSILLAFIAAGGWVGYQERAQRSTLRPLTSAQPTSSIEVVEEDGEKILKNHAANYEITLQKDWVVAPNPGADYFALFAPDKTDYCRIELSSADNNNNLSEQQYFDSARLNAAKIKQLDYTLISYDQSEVTYNYHNFFKQYINSEEGGQSVTAIFVSGNKINSLYVPIRARHDNCEKVLDDLLPRISES